ncbi:DNA polymerase III subunit gamma/tau [Candidatus Marinamargulisbacteria bacterium SCGC AG-343-K17]|nr:DNA polymerase III subunit gamma/tau [Candidatus Marinamargulisbacteria bacterium SCGC AG-343-K17]
MTYQTLYRKYRSNDLSELVGQSHIIQTLTNALSHDRLSHAYIFSGPRGTGKTSTARILAKMVNKTVDDVNQCEICQKIAQGVCVDVIEIDAASHTGVDHMRQLTEQVQFLPVEATYKVFIIDEVHMLSTGAFNALLKTLEEPPSNVLFILATTELNKIPATIQSRAQTLHFRLLDADQIKQHVLHICSEESFTIDPQALTKLVQVSNGGMRDALSLLDQLMSISDNQAISLSDMTGLLGSLDDGELVSFLTSCFLCQPESYQSLKQYVDQGIDVFQLYDDVISYLHHVLLIEESHSFSVSDAVVSEWLQWFCDQVSYLKNTPSPAVAAQVALYARVASNNDVSSSTDVLKASVQVSTPKVSPSFPKSEIKASPDVVLSKPVSPPIVEDVAPQPVDTSMNVKETPQERSTSLPEQSSDSKAVCDRVLQTLSKEFQVLMPVLKNATLIENKQTLCLILDETYQFFEKKLNEDKFKTRFLGLYNELSNQTLSEWMVTSDVNLIYNQPQSVTVEDKGEAQVENVPVQSKTVNQIIEMFEGQVLK